MGRAEPDSKEQENHPKVASGKLKRRGGQIKEGVGSAGTDMYVQQSVLVCDEERELSRNLGGNRSGLSVCILFFLIF